MNIPVMSVVVDMSVLHNKFDTSNALPCFHWECRALDIQRDLKPVRGTMPHQGNPACTLSGDTTINYLLCSTDTSTSEYPTSILLIQKFKIVVPLNHRRGCHRSSPELTSLELTAKHKIQSHDIKLSGINHPEFLGTPDVDPLGNDLNMKYTIKRDLRHISEQEDFREVVPNCTEADATGNSGMSSLP
jgi:hypothetical protein